MDTTNPIRILVIVAHPDDIEFGVAGTIAGWTDEGAVVSYCIVTDGAAGTNQPGADLRALAATRRAEQIAAAAAVGVYDVRFLGYQDGTLRPTLELRRELTRLIRELRPYRVVCQDPSLIFWQAEYINHPDHRAAGEAAVYAVFPSAETRPIFPELLDEGFEPHHVSELYLAFSPEANTTIDISATIDRKIAALLCHRSQVGPEVEQWVRQWDAEAGQATNTPYAESFRVMRFVDT